MEIDISQEPFLLLLWNKTRFSVSIWIVANTPQPPVVAGSWIHDEADQGLSGGAVRPELAKHVDSDFDESTDSRRHIASGEWPART